MKKLLFITLSLIIFSGQGYGRMVATVQVHEWGVLTWNNNPVFSSTPGTVVAATETDIPVLPPNHNEMLLRAPVLYFHGPNFTATVTVKTNNGSIFDVYPTVPNMQRDSNFVSWTAVFKNETIEEYPSFHGLAPGEWNYDLWRIDSPLSIFTEDGWNDKFLYYETAPVTTNFLPYIKGQDTLCEEYENIEAIIIKPNDANSVYTNCSLNDFVQGREEETVTVSSNAILGILYSWSTGLLEFEETDALWNTWSQWIMEGYKEEEAYSNGFVLYLIPQNLAKNLSYISVETITPFYNVETSRFLLVAIPL